MKLLSFPTLCFLSSAIIAPGHAQQSMSGETPQNRASARSETPFACVRNALTAQARKRHFDELSPMLRARKKSIRELADGFEFEFPSDPATLALVNEWVAGEVLCCPFFDIDTRLEREGGPLWLRLTGREGVKVFIKSEFAPWFRT